VEEEGENTITNGWTGKGGQERVRASWGAVQSQHEPGEGDKWRTDGE
jgi:hypothetical protein